MSKLKWMLGFYIVCIAGGVGIAWTGTGLEPVNDLLYRNAGTYTGILTECCLNCLVPCFVAVVGSLGFAAFSENHIKLATICECFTGFVFFCAAASGIYVYNVCTFPDIDYVSDIIALVGVTAFSMVAIWIVSEVEGAITD